MSPEPILIVDDNPANLKLARVLLHASGYEVREATDAEQALKLLETFRPRLILMDIQLPGMDGLTLTRLLKDDPATKDIIIIALTAYAMKGDEARTRAAGCDGYVSKPIDTDALLRIVGGHVRASASSRPDILVVEDNAATRKVFRIALRDKGYEVVEAPDAAAAIQSVKEHPPSLALIDLLLPDMSGGDLARRIRALPGGAEIPLIAVSGFPGLAGDAHGGIGEFDAVIAKPVEPHRLVEVVCAYLPSTSDDPKASPIGDKHVLVVDDDAVQRKLTAVHLRHAGFHVVTAQGAADGLEIARAQPPDLIVSDVLMPEVDGFALCMQVRADPRLAHLPVVLASAYYCEREDEDLARRVGANALVVRSPDMGELVRVVQSRLGTKAPQAGDESPVVIEQAHQQRVVQKLERQAIANAGMARRCALQSAQLSILGGIADALTKSRDLPLAVGEVLASCLDAGGISKGALYRLERDEGLVLQNAIGFTDMDRSESAFGCARLLDDVMTSGMPVSIRAASTGDANAFLSRLGVTSALVVPLIGNGERVGALLLGSNVVDLDAPDVLGFARSMAAYIGQAMALGLAFERVQTARREAERASRAKDEFLSTLSHELRTPLTAILGWATMLRTKRRDPSLVERAMTTIERNAKAQARLIDDMLDLARINAGKVRLDAHAIRVIPLIQAGLEAVAPAGEAKGVRLEVDLDPAAGLLWGDPSRVQQIVWNLLINGVKFTPSGGVVRTRLVGRDGKMEISVSDTGIGIAEEFLPYVFDRFRQADSSNTRAHGGLGLGLAIVRQLVELHGGEIRAESAGAGRGATFTVSFPVHAPHDAPLPARPRPGRRAPPPAPRLDGVRVLTVEDEPDTREMLAVVLHAAGAEVAAAASAAEALGAIAREVPHVLVSDISMPDMSGYDLVRAIRRLPAPEGTIPAVAITAYASLDDRRTALEAGFEEHLAKPVDPEVLITTVARLREEAFDPSVAEASRGA